jgi:hypothetical protein
MGSQLSESTVLDHLLTTATDNHQSYAVFLAYYINSGEFDGASDITFAFVGGLSFSIGDLPPFRCPKHH